MNRESDIDRQYELEKRKHQTEIASDIQNRGYVVKKFEDSTGQPLYVFRGAVEVERQIVPCDTTWSINTDNLPGQGRAEFSTFIHTGKSGKNVEHWNRVLDDLNYHLPGKLVRDYTDNSDDVLYVTSEPLSGLNQGIVVENIHHHAQVKGSLFPQLERLNLELEQNAQIIDESDIFAKEFVSQIQKQKPTEIPYLRMLEQNSTNS